MKNCVTGPSFANRLFALMNRFFFSNCPFENRFDLFFLGEENQTATTATTATTTTATTPNPSVIFLGRHLRCRRAKSDADIDVGVASSLIFPFFSFFFWPGGPHPVATLPSPSISAAAFVTRFFFLFFSFLFGFLAFWLFLARFSCFRAFVSVADETSRHEPADPNGPQLFHSFDWLRLGFTGLFFFYWVSLVIFLDITECYRVLLGLIGFWLIFLPGSSGFYWVSLFFFWVSLDLAGFSWVSLGFIRFYWVLLGFTGLKWVFLGFTGFYWVLFSFLPGFSRFCMFYGVLLGFSRFYMFYGVLLGFTGYYWVFLVPTGLCLFFNGFHRVILGFTRFY